MVIFREVPLLLPKLLARGSCELPEGHGEDRFGLGLAEEVAVHEAVLGLFDGLGVTDEADDLVDVVHGGGEALDDVQALAGLPQVELRAPPDDLDPVVDVALEFLLEGEVPRLPVDKGEVDYSERGLHL